MTGVLNKTGKQSGSDQGVTSRIRENRSQVKYTFSLHKCTKMSSKRLIMGLIPTIKSFKKTCYFNKVLYLRVKIDPH